MTLASNPNSQYGFRSGVHLGEMAGRFFRSIEVLFTGVTAGFCSGTAAGDPQPRATARPHGVDPAPIDPNPGFGVGFYRPQ
jgi:hypothetical protein